MLPELERSREAIVLYTETELLVVSKDSQVVADLVTYNGATWKVIAIDKHGEGILDHFRAIAQRV